MVSHICIFYSSNCGSSEDISKPLSPEGKLLNIKSVYSVLFAGVSRSGLNDITAAMDMLPPISHHFFL